MKSRIIRLISDIDYTKGNLLESIHVQNLIVMVCPDETLNAHRTQFYGIYVNDPTGNYTIGNLDLFTKNDFRIFAYTVEIKND